MSFIWRTFFLGIWLMCFSVAYSQTLPESPSNAALGNIAMFTLPTEFTLTMPPVEEAETTNVYPKMYVYRNQLNSIEILVWKISKNSEITTIQSLQRYNDNARQKVQTSAYKQLSLKNTEFAKSKALVSNFQLPSIIEGKQTSNFEIITKHSNYLLRITVSLDIPLRDTSLSFNDLNQRTKELLDSVEHSWRWVGSATPSASQRK